MMRRRWIICLVILTCAACAPATPTPTANVTPRLDEGRAHLALYEWDRAIAAFSEAIALSPAAAEAYCLRGLAYASGPGGTDARTAAIADYTQCRALASTGPLATQADAALLALSAAATAGSN